MKKILSLIMALMMLVLPMSGMAMTEEEILDAAKAAGKAITVTGTNHLTEEAASLFNDESMAAVIDLYNSLTMTATEQEGLYTFSVALSDVTALSLTFEVAGDALYVGSNLLEKPIIVDKTEIIAAIKQVVLPMMQAAGVISEEDAAMISGWVDELAEGKIPAELQAMLEQYVNAMSSIDMSEVSLDNTMNWLMSTVMSAKTEEAADAPVPCDPVSSVTVVALDGNAIAGMIEAVCADVKASPSIVNFIAQTTGKDAVGAIDHYVPDITNALTSNAEKIGLAIKLYSGEADLSAVSMEAFLKDDSNDFGFIFAVGETTIENGTETVLLCKLTNGGNDLVSLSGGCDCTVDEEGTQIYGIYGEVNVMGTAGLALNVGLARDTVDLPATAMNAKLTILQNGSEAGSVIWELVENTMVDEAGEYVITISDLVSIAMGEQKIDLLSTEMTISTGAALPSIATADATRFSTMDEDALGNWLSSAAMYAIGQLSPVLQVLPESVMSLLN